MTRPFIVTIDGPAGAGKSTVARALAGRLSCLYLDTGALYRALALKVIREGVSETDAAALAELCRRTKIRLDHAGGGMRVFLDGEDVTKEIRGEAVSIAASTVSAQPPVRAALLDLQREAALQGSLVAEGRDMGTVVFPGADMKFFLDASPRERALRRYRELDPQGSGANLESVERDMSRRDQQDRGRTVAPLRIAEDARVIDCSTIPAEEVVEEMLREIETKRRALREMSEQPYPPGGDPGKTA
jgi:cytidylate kinase